MSIDVLLPTINRLPSLVFTLSGVVNQTRADLHVVVADQSDEPVCNSSVVQTLFRLVEVRGGCVEYHHRPQVHGIAEQRNFLLDQARSDGVLYLDDDVYMEATTVFRMAAVLSAQECGFVGAFPQGLSHLEDRRPEQEPIEYWSRVVPEVVEPNSEKWNRWQLHRAANLYHATTGMAVGETRLYKIAWIASCILYDRRMLERVGGFAFWNRLPRYHSGEEVVVQNLLMRLYGGCGIAPSGTYYSQAPTTVLNREGTVDGHALELLPELVARYCGQTEQEGSTSGTGGLGSSSATSQ